MTYASPTRVDCPRARGGGGRGSRLGNDAKAAITIGDTSVFDRLLSSIPEGVPVVVDGPERPTQRRVTFRREWPLHGGPVAGIVCGLEAAVPWVSSATLMTRTAFPHCW